MSITKSPRTQVHLRVEHGCAWIVLDGERTKNALDAVSAAAVVDACDRIDADRTIGAAVITGSAGSFCSGAARDVLSNLNAASADTVYDTLDSLYAAFARVGSLSVPTIARVDGPAVGAGLNLALACDLRVASTRASFVSGFAAAGIHPGGGHFHLLDRIAGRQAGAAMGLFAAPVSAQRALELGLTWCTVEPTELDLTVNKLTRHLRHDPALSRRAKSSFALTTSTTSDWFAATEVERSRQMWSMTRDTPAPR